LLAKPSTEDFHPDNISMALEIHKEMKMNYIKKQIFEKMFNKFKDMLLNKTQIEKVMEEGEQILDK
jgi:hypothetical protein